MDVVAATANLVVLRVPALQLHAQLPHHPLQVAVSAVHQDVVLLQLLLVADDLDGGEAQSVRGPKWIMDSVEGGETFSSVFYLFLFLLPHPPLVLEPREIVLTHPPLIHELSFKSVHLRAEDGGKRFMLTCLALKTHLYLGKEEYF